MKIRVSKHVACAWSWGLSMQQDPDTGEWQYALNLKKAHPTWEFFRHLVDHLPLRIQEKVVESRWYNGQWDKHSATIASYELTSQQCMQLDHAFWTATQHIQDHVE